jgi:AsmA protein
MSGSGAASLRDLTFQLGINAAINEELEALDEACRVEERYLAIDWPVKCVGNLGGDATRWCAIDRESIVKQLLANEAKSKLQKQADKLGEKAGNALKKLFGG